MPRLSGKTKALAVRRAEAKRGPIQKPSGKYPLVQVGKNTWMECPPWQDPEQLREKYRVHLTSQLQAMKTKVYYGK